MFFEIDGYLLSYDKKHNRIYITLPQTAETQTNTFEPVRERRTDLSMEEQLSLLRTVYYMFERRVDVVPVRHGHVDNGRCSICGHVINAWANDFVLCPYCGATMDEVEE